MSQLSHCLHSSRCLLQLWGENRIIFLRVLCTAFQRNTITVQWSACHLQSCLSSVSITFESGQACSMITLGIQLGPDRRLHAIKDCPTCQSQVLAQQSCGCFCWACFSSTHYSQLGFSRSNLVQIFLCGNKVHGGTPIMAWGTLL